MEEEKKEQVIETPTKIVEERVMSVEEPARKSEEELINLRLGKTLKKIKKNKNLITYAILAVIVWIAVSIRTLNIDRLKDITTNDWTLGPDLDPFLFLRWAEYIAENGKLFIIDTLRNVPLGFNTSGEAILLPYMMAWLFKFLNFLPNSLTSLLPGNPSEITINYAALIFPVFMFAFTIVAFFFLTREIFKNSFENKIYPNIIGLIASIFLSIIPALLPRTIAGIPEKESVAFLFIFLSFYFLLIAFKSKNTKKIVINSLLGGLSIAALGLIWGGVTFVFLIIGLSFIAAYFIGIINKKRILSYVILTATFMPILMFYSSRFTLIGFLTSSSTAPIFIGLFLSIFDIYLYDKIKNNKTISKMNNKFNLPRELSIALLIGIVLSILLVIYTLVIDPGFLSEKITSLYNNIIRPLGASRFTRTVAENRQPFFVGEWKSSFGPLYNGLPIFFWLFMVGALTLFFNMVKELRKKDKWSLTLAFAAFIFAMIFSKYSSNSSLNGISTFSTTIYLIGAILFVFTFLYILHKYHKKDERELLKFDFSLILLITMFFISIMAARSAVRFMMVLVPPASIMVGYLITFSFKKAYYNNGKGMKLIAWSIFGIILIASIYSGLQYYNSSEAQANSFYPSGYQFQWQKAMQWVRNNTQEDAVFSHWWDYGYWIQSIGKRATVLDGGNAIVYWNHLLGRHVLTGSDENKALEFLKTHDATHLLIDSTDIGKYSAFSSIGGDENNDRFSFIPSMFMDSSSTQETKNGIIYVYPSGAGLDEDITFEDNGTQIYLARENTGLGGIIIEEDSQGRLLQPKALFVQQGRQIQVPLRYLYFNNNLQDFGDGLESGVFIIETLVPQGNSLVKNEKGALFYLSKRTVNSILVRKFLFEEEGNFKLVHTQPTTFTEDLRNQGFEIDDFAYFQGNLLGPIKIWEIQYPANIEENPAFLETQYPDKRLI